MRIAFLHQNFPGQFFQVANALQRKATHDLVAVIPRTNTRPRSIPARRYDWTADHSRAAANVAANYVECTSRANAVADALLALKAEGFTPDLVVGHGGWGETLFVRDVWPDVPILLHAEFFHRAEGLDTGFDPEIANPDPPRHARQVRARSVVMLQGVADATRGVAPTLWQADTFPALLRPKIEIAHEGIDTVVARPDPDALLTLRRDGVVLRPGDEVVTFVARNLEHYRGFHVFMRTLPAILRARPKGRIVIVGGDTVSYGPAAPSGTTWRHAMLTELAGELDMSRVHFVGRVPHPRFIQLMQVSAAHVYLTYPFVLSWSMLEAMSAGALVIGARTGPVLEVIEDGRNGVLVARIGACRIGGRPLYPALGRSVAQPGRALASGARGRRFESSRSDQHRSSQPGRPQHQPADRQHPNRPRHDEVAELDDPVHRPQRVGQRHGGHHVEGQADQAGEGREQNSWHRARLPRDGLRGNAPAD